MIPAERTTMAVRELFEIHLYSRERHGHDMSDQPGRGRVAKDVSVP